MNFHEVMDSLSEMGDENTKKTYLRHGAKEPLFGVKIGDLKTLKKKVKKNHELALELYDSGNSDAMYLAALISEPEKMDRALLDRWASGANNYGLSEFAVAWVAAESGIGFETALDWIESDRENVCSSGWATLSGIVALTPDEELDLKTIEKLLDRIGRDIHTAPNRVRYAMNGFIISVGGYVKPLFEKAETAAKEIGEVSVNMGDTSCKVPLAAEYIEKMEKSGRRGTKRKTVFC